ncbi:MAG: alpha/beta fold hydrolase [Limnochordia bacterium]
MSIGKRPAIGLVLTLTAVMVFALTTSAHGQNRQYIIKQAGKEIGTAEISIEQGWDTTYMTTQVRYPDSGVEFQTIYLLSGKEFPKKPVEYQFSMWSPFGGLVVDMAWNETAGYSIDQGPFISFDTGNVLALDNNVISDYMVAAWIYDKAAGGALEAFLAVPILLPQGTGILPMTISYLGEEQFDNYITDHFQVNVGVTVDLWVEQADRSLVMLQIPMQAFEIAAAELDEVAQTEQVYTFPELEGSVFTEESFSIEVDRARISGTLTIPELQGKLPGVILVAGSGPTDRDGNSYVMPGPANYLKEIAHYLAARGIVTLRFDKRGVGKSPGQVSAFSDYINDIYALVDFLAGLENVDPERIFIVGHSEGAWLASEVARMRDDLRGIGLLAGPGFVFIDTIKRQMLEQSEAGIAAGMFDPDLSSRLESALDELYDAVLSDMDYDLSLFNLPTEFEQVILSFWYQKELLKDWFPVDPAAVLSEVGVPVLIIQGTADVQVRVLDAQRLADALPEHQRELHIISGIDHVLKMTYGEPLPYTDPNRRVHPQVLEIIGDWIAAH